jgi:Ni/Fe-hydrogenase subunit HybB-like protein
MKINTSKITFWKVVAGIIFVFGAYAAIIRFTKGLGTATNLSDEFPWGLWIGFDVLIGVGLAAGGFVIAATVHIFNLEKYKPISRPTILTAFLGYLLVIVALLFDLGRPYRIWHPLIMWNPNSVMFEIAWCVTLYTTVLALEFSPIVFEKFNLKVPLKFIRMLYIPIVIVGVLLSTLHQSSLGTIYVIVPDKLHGLWYSSWLPVFFFVSAISAGLAMTILESFLSFRAFGKRLEKDILTGIARVIVVVLAVYFVMRFQDLIQQGNLYLAFNFDRESVLFWGEIGLGVIVPMILLFIARVRENETFLFFSALLVILGFIVNRLNVTIGGILHSETYFPKWSEFAVTLAIITLGFAAFGFAVKYFPVFPEAELIKDKKFSGKGAEKTHPVFTGKIVTGLWALILLGIIIYGITGYAEKSSLAVPVNDVPFNRSINLSREYPNLPEHFDFISSLHYTARGMNYWYSKVNGGLEKITGVPYSDLGCKNCHVSGCDACHREVKDGKTVYSSTAGNQSICLECHGREGAIMKIDSKAGQEDVHFTIGMTCVDCHTVNEIHGNGKEYLSMKEEEAMEVQCEDCHDYVEPTISHTVHKDKLDCRSCHSRHVLSCTNCHFDFMAQTGKRLSIPVSGWLFLINHKGKVTSAGMQNFVAKGNKTFLIFAPHMSHSIMKDGRKCEECHGTEISRQVQKGKVTLTWLEDGKVKNLKGVIPVVDGVNYKCVYHDLKDNMWIPINNPADPHVQYPAFGEPLTKKQIENLVKIQKMLPQVAE